MLQELSEDDLKDVNQTGEKLLSRLPDDDKDILQEKLCNLNERWLHSWEKLLAKCAELENETSLSQQYLDTVQRAQDQAIEIDQLIRDVNQSEPENIDELRKNCEVSLDF
jgi:hypothetical protein